MRFSSLPFDCFVILRICLGILLCQIYREKGKSSESIACLEKSLGLSEAVHQMVINDATPLTHPSA